MSVRGFVAQAKQFKPIAKTKHVFHVGAFQDTLSSVIYYFYKRKCFTAKVEDTFLTTVHSFLTFNITK